MVPQGFQRTVNISLKKFFFEKKKKLVRFDSRLGELVDQISDMTLRGGDRVRPYFCWLGFQAVGGTDLKQILPVVLALELIQSYALIHDDIMDEADSRRGGPTIHAYFTQNHRNHHQVELQASSLALLAGDLCNLWAHELFNQANYFDNRHSGKPEGRTQNFQGILKQVQDDKLYNSQKLFLSMQEEVISGQTMDVWGMQFTDTNSILRMYELKSASYTVEKPLLIGACMGNTDLKTTAIIYQSLSIYGQKIGLAFQLRDDELGVFGDEATTGKSVSSDLVEGKWTYLVALTYAALSSVEKKKLERLFSKQQRTIEDAEWIKSKLISSGARVKQRRLMERLVEQAIEGLDRAEVKNKRELVEMARFAIERNF